VSNFVYLPGLPSPMSLPSNSTTGIISFVVEAINSSSAPLACCGVNDFSIVFNPIFLLALITNLRVMEGRILTVSAVVCSVRPKIAKNAEAAPSVIKPFSSTSIASLQPLLAASWRARTLANRFSDLISHRFHHFINPVAEEHPTVKINPFKL